MNPPPRLCFPHVDDKPNRHPQAAPRRSSSSFASASSFWTSHGDDDPGPAAMDEPASAAERFKLCPAIQGHNDLLNLTQPQMSGPSIASTWSRRGHHRNEHVFNSNTIFDGRFTAWNPLAPELNLAGAKTPARGRRGHGGGPRARLFCRGRDWPDHQKRVHGDRCHQPAARAVPTIQLAEATGSRRARCWRAHRSLMVRPGWLTCRRDLL